MVWFRLVVSLWLCGFMSGCLDTSLKEAVFTEGTSKVNECDASQNRHFLGAGEPVEIDQLPPGELELRSASVLLRSNSTFVNDEAIMAVLNPPKKWEVYCFAPAYRGRKFNVEVYIPSHFEVRRNGSWWISETKKIRLNFSEVSYGSDGSTQNISDFLSPQDLDDWKTRIRNSAGGQIMFYRGISDEFELIWKQPSDSLNDYRSQFFIKSVYNFSSR